MGVPAFNAPYILPAGSAAPLPSEPLPYRSPAASVALAPCLVPASFSQAQLQYIGYLENSISQNKTAVCLYVDTSIVQTQSPDPRQDLKRAIEHLQGKGFIHSYRCGQDQNRFYIILNLSKEEQEWCQIIRNKIQSRKPGEAIVIEPAALNQESTSRVLDFLLVLKEIQAVAYYYDPSGPVFYNNRLPLRIENYVLKVSEVDRFDPSLLRSTWKTYQEVRANRG